MSANPAPEPPPITGADSDSGRAGSSGFGAEPRPAPGMPSSDENSSPPDPSPKQADPKPPEAPGLFEQVRATKDAGTRMLGAHVDLAKAEFGDIVEHAKKAAVLVGIALGVALAAALLVTVGLPLFLGEALFGSMGWGILLGVLWLAAIGSSAAVAALRPGVHVSIGRAFLGGLVVAVVVGIVLGANLTNRAWSAVGDAVLPGVGADVRPLATAVGALAILGAVIALILALLKHLGIKAALGMAVAGLVGGVLLGFLTAYAAGPRVGAAIGMTAGLITWMALLGAAVARGTFDMDALKDRFWPAATIEATKETIEWVRERTPLSRKS